LRKDWFPLDALEKTKFRHPLTRFFIGKTAGWDLSQAFANELKSYRRWTKKWTKDGCNHSAGFRPALDHKITVTLFDLWPANFLPWRHEEETTAGLIILKQTPSADFILAREA